MRNSIFGIFVIALLVFTSCSKDSTNVATDSDTALIEAIQLAKNKVSIRVGELPSSTQTVLNEEYVEDYVDAAKLAPELGYEVNLRCAEGPLVGERQQAYFDLKGRKLTADSYKGDKDGYDKETTDRKRICFHLVLPVTFTMPDGTEITIANKEDWALIRAWYAEHPDSQAKPEIQFPVDIKFKDGTVKTIENMQQMRRAIAFCKDQNDQDNKKCFQLLYPVTYIMPDDSEITINNKEDMGLIRAWYAEHPDFVEKPSIKFPVDIKWYEGTVQTINNKEEMMEARKKCGDQDGDKRCFKLVLPVTFTMPDESEITIAEKEDWALIKAWYAEHPDVAEKPSLQYPVGINYFGTDGIVTINNEKEMQAAKDDCNKGDKD